MAEEVKKLDLEELKDKDKLSEEELDTIAKEAIAEVDGPPKPEEEIPAPEPEVKPEPEPEPEETEEEKAERELKEQKEKDDVLLEKPEEELTDEEKARKEELLKVREEEKAKAYEEEVTAYATENNLNAEEARKELESISGIGEKYQNDPKKLAKAYLHQQRLVSKKDEEISTLKSTPAPAPLPDVTVEQIADEINQGTLTYTDDKGVVRAQTKEYWVNQYRNHEPGLTEGLEDGQVIHLIAREIHQYRRETKAKQLNELSVKAKERRIEIINSLSEADKKYSKEVKEFLVHSPDASILGDNFDPKQIVFWAKGMKYDADIKAAEEKGFKRGQEQAKIIDKQPPVGKPTTKAKANVAEKLTEAQKTRALEMFDGQEMTEEEKYKSFMEIYADEFKK